MAKKPMTKKDIVAAMSKEVGLTQVQAEAVFESIVNLAKSEVAAGRTFRLSGLGTFSMRKSAARKGVNPATGEAIQIPAKKKMVFKSASAVEEMLNPQK